MLTPPALPAFPPDDPDDPRLSGVIQLQPAKTSLRLNRPILLGFPVDEGVRRNGGRIGAALAPDAIRRFLYRLTAADAASGIDIASIRPVDLGNLRPLPSLEQSQENLGCVIGEILASGAVPIILGGGHETAFGHYLGYSKARLQPAVINLDAHLDVRRVVDGLGTSGTPFRQMMELQASPLKPGSYACLGVQPHSVSHKHWEFCRQRGDTLMTAEELRGTCRDQFEQTCGELGKQHDAICVSVDADVVAAGDVPGVSAPNSTGLSGSEMTKCARSAGTNAAVASLDLVEINPLYDQDDRSARWAATLIWNFLIGLTTRSSS